MNCKKCGKLLNENEKFCMECGTPVDSVENIQNNVMQPSQPSPEVQNATIAQPVPIVNTPQPEVNNNFNQETNNQNYMNQNVQSTPVQPVNYAGNSQNAPSGNNNFKIIVAVLIAAVVIIGGFAAYKVFSNKDSDNNNIQPKIEDTPTNQVENPVNSNNGNVYTYNNFQFAIPNGYTASEQEGLLFLKGSQANVAIYIYEYLTLEDVIAEIDTLKAQYTNSGYSIKSTEQKTYNGKEWLLMPATYTKDGQPMDLTIAYTDLGQYHLIESLVVVRPGYDAIYTDLSKMFETATYKGTSSFSKDNKKGKIESTLKVDESKLKFEN